ncbi:unnamed protein product [Chrysoparadoxa australica]
MLRVKRLEGEVSSLKEVRAELEAEITVMRESHPSQSQLRLSEDRIQALEREAQALHEAKHRLQSELEAVKETAVDEGDLRRKEKDLTQSILKVKKLEEEVKVVREAKLTLEAEVVAMRETGERSPDRSDMLRKDRELEQHQARVKQLEGEVVFLKEGRDVLLQQVVAGDESREAVESLGEETARVALHVKDEREQHRLQVKSLEDELEGLREAKAVLEEELESVRGDGGPSGASTQPRNAAQVKRLEAEASSLRQAKAGLEQELSAAQRRIEAERVEMQREKMLWVRANEKTLERCRALELEKQSLSVERESLSNSLEEVTAANVDQEAALASLRRLIASNESSEGLQNDGVEGVRVQLLRRMSELEQMKLSLDEERAALQEKGQSMAMVAQFQDRLVRMKDLEQKLRQKAAELQDRERALDARDKLLSGAERSLLDQAQNLTASQEQASADLKRAVQRKEAELTEWSGRLAGQAHALSEQQHKLSAAYNQMKDRLHERREEERDESLEYGRGGTSMQQESLWFKKEQRKLELEREHLTTEWKALDAAEGLRRRQEEAAVLQLQYERSALQMQIQELDSQRRSLEKEKEQLALEKAPQSHSHASTLHETSFDFSEVAYEAPKDSSMSISIAGDSSLESRPPQLQQLLEEAHVLQELDGERALLQRERLALEEERAVINREMEVLAEARSSMAQERSRLQEELGWVSSERGALQADQSLVAAEKQRLLGESAQLQREKEALLRRVEEGREEGGVVGMEESRARELENTEEGVRGTRPVEEEEEVLAAAAGGPVPKGAVTTAAMHGALLSQVSAGVQVDIKAVAPSTGTRPVVQPGVTGPAGLEVTEAVGVNAEQYAEKAVSGESDPEAEAKTEVVAEQVTIAGDGDGDGDGGGGGIERDGVGEDSTSCQADAAGDAGDEAGAGAPSTLASDAAAAMANGATVASTHIPAAAPTAASGGTSDYALVPVPITEGPAETAAVAALVQAPPMAMPAAVSYAAVGLDSDPFLQEIEARLAGTQHDLERSIGQRDALLNDAVSSDFSDAQNTDDSLYLEQRLAAMVSTGTRVPRFAGPHGSYHPHQQQERVLAFDRLPERQPVVAGRAVLEAHRLGPLVGAGVLGEVSAASSGAGAAASVPFSSSVQRRHAAEPRLSQRSEARPAVLARTDSVPEAASQLTAAAAATRKQQQGQQQPDLVKGIPRFEARPAPSGRRSPAGSGAGEESSDTEAEKQTIRRLMASLNETRAPLMVSPSEFLRRSQQLGSDDGGVESDDDEGEGEEERKSADAGAGATLLQNLKQERSAEGFTTALASISLQAALSFGSSSADGEDDGSNIAS